MMMMMMEGSCRTPFTASQRQELELQALIFKYMVSGIPVPHDLILCIRRSLFMDPQAFAFLPHPPAIGWGMYQLGDGRKAADPEPGRCRRTDGKKWRCSKEAFPDSKYCERHMHRGKSRSRKPVELSLATNPTSSHFSASPNFPPLSLSTTHPRHGVFPCPASARPAASGCSQQDDNYWNIRAFKGDANEYPFFSEACRARRGTLNAEEGEQEKHCFVLGADFKTERAAKLEREGQALNSVRPFHCFLDEKPPKVEGSWMSMDVDQSKQASSLKTQLSISISASQCYNDG